MVDKTIIYLIGDAILDNYETLENKTQDLTKELTDLNFIVHNFAVDEIRVKDIINGIFPKDKYIKTRHYMYPIEKDNKMYPLKLLISRSKINKSFTSMYSEVGSLTSNLKCNDMVVLSMGGNDIAPNMSKILFGTEFFVNSILTNNFMLDYKKIIEITKGACEHIVLVSLYLPYLGLGSSYSLYTPFAVPIINRWTSFIKEMGRQYNIPVLDLSRSLDTGNKKHYSSDDRLSNFANICFAKCIQYICNNYEGHRVYYAPNLEYLNIRVE